MLTHNPLIIRGVITKERLTPEVMRPLGAAACLKPIFFRLNGIRMLGDNLAVVIGAVRSVLALPEEIEQADIAFSLSAVGNGVVHRQFTAS